MVALHLGDDRLAQRRRAGHRGVLGVVVADRLDRLAGAETIGRRTLNGRGRVQVVAVDLVQALLFFERHER